MAYGLRIMDASGNEIVGVSTNLTRRLGIATVTAGVAGSVVHAGLATGRPYYIRKGGSYDSTGVDVSFSGTTMSWTVGTFAASIIFGVY